MAALCSTCWAMPRAGSAQATFTGLGDLPGGAFQSQAEAVSDDGVAVVGIGTAATGPQAFRWQAVGGMVGLGGLPGGPVFSFAFGVSGDGSVVVGNAIPDAFVWDAERGMRSVRDVLAGLRGRPHRRRCRHQPERAERGLARRPSAVALPERTRRRRRRARRPSRRSRLRPRESDVENPECDDGDDDDADGFIDHPADPGCLARSDPSERPTCSDALDNDLDGATDFPQDAGCTDADDALEEAACDDGLDDDGDGLVDFDDPACDAHWPYWESAPCGVGAELAFGMPVLIWLAARRRRHRDRNDPSR
ncbi:MAG: hypothetical protein DCC71_08510 [Proteobacteria bacterium]|nr:MAG: hypothetical protein DCC71_08510 [Pseudomonadota bacterium]